MDGLGAIIDGTFQGMDQSIKEKQQLESIVAELVALLRMGRELAEAARDSVQGTPQKRYQSSNEANAILERYDAAIAKHGGE